MSTDETKRRLIHASGGVFPLLYLGGVVTWPQLRYLFLFGLVVTGVLEFARLVLGINWWLFEELTREYEESNVAGYALYIASSAFVILVFEPRFAVPAILMLAVADPVSGYLGADELRTIKRPRVLVVTFGIGVLIAAPFVHPVAIILGAVTATVADGVKPVIAGYVIDDNLTIPIGAAVAMYIGTVWIPTF